MKPNTCKEADKETELKKQIEVDIDGITMIINHRFSGTRSLREVYADLLESRLIKQQISL
jgi:hypothetical protein